MAKKSSGIFILIIIIVLVAIVLGANESKHNFLGYKDKLDKNGNSAKESFKGLSNALKSTKDVSKKQASRDKEVSDQIKDLDSEEEIKQTDNLASEDREELGNLLNKVGK